MKRILLLTFIKTIPDNQLPDKELVTLYQQHGDLEVLGLLYQRYMDLVFGVCLKYLIDSESSKDAVMQIFEELVQKLRKYEVENFKSWLHTLAKNYCLMQLRTPKNLKTTEFSFSENGRGLGADVMQSDEDVHLNGAMQKEENFKRMEKCLQTLSPEQKATVEMFYLENKCYKEIAEVTGIEWNKVRSYIQNGRRNLKICMDKTSIV